MALGWFVILQLLRMEQKYWDFDEFELEQAQI